jgi:drug/metabolite transporter (DMT)-like permease
VTLKPASTALIVVNLLVLYVLWGATYLGMLWAIAALPPFYMSSVRFFLAGLPMYILLRLTGATRPTLKDWRQSGLISLCLMVGANGGVAFSEQYISTGLAALLISTVPLWIIVLAWWHGTGPRPTSRIAIGLACGFAGMILLVLPHLRWDRDFSVESWKGIVAALGSALIWSTGSLYARNGQLSVTPLLGVSMQMVQASAGLAMVAWVTGETGAVDYHLLTSRAIGAFIFLVLAAPIGFSAYLWLLKVCTPSIVTTYAFVNPVIATALGWALAGESVTLSMLTGAACLVLGVALVVLGQPAKAPAAELTEEQAPL